MTADRDSIRAASRRLRPSSRRRASRRLGSVLRAALPPAAGDLPVAALLQAVVLPVAAAPPGGWGPPGRWPARWASRRRSSEAVGDRQAVRPLGAAGDLQAALHQVLRREATARLRAAMAHRQALLGTRPDRPDIPPVAAAFLVHLRPASGPRWRASRPSHPATRSRSPGSASRPIRERSWRRSSSV